MEANVSLGSSSYQSHLYGVTYGACPNTQLVTGNGKLAGETYDLLQQDCTDLKLILVLYELCMFKFYSSRD